MSLRAAGPGGTETKTVSDCVVTKPIFADDHICSWSNENATVHFEDRSQGNITSWLWEFGDCTTSTERNPTHVYAPGSYSVRLTVAGPQYSDTTTKVNRIINTGLRLLIPLKGDVNSDEHLDLSDAIMALQLISGKDCLCPRRIQYIDVDGDAKIGTAEVLYVLQKIAAVRSD